MTDSSDDKLLQHYHSRLTSDMADINILLKSLTTCPDLCNLLTKGILCSLEFEKILVNIRKILLLSTLNNTIKDEHIHFITALSIQCNYNEYIYPFSDNETKATKQLTDSLYNANNHSVTTSVLCLYSHPYKIFSRLTELQLQDIINNPHLSLLKNIYDNKIKEISISKNICTITEISNETSLDVQTMYEESPYPTWNTPPYIAPNSVHHAYKNNDFRFKNREIIKKAKTILVAGCGTGHQSVQIALLSPKSEITAIDLSKNSLSYAARKTRELGIRNIDYYQADINNIPDIDSRFDMIFCGGVLHHMKNPVAGWEALTKVLSKDGVMQIALYSSIARRHITEIRQAINKIQQPPYSDMFIREFRHNLRSYNFDIETVNNILQSSDFYSLNACRDLLFHIQETTYTLIEIQDILDRLNLSFCGLDVAPSITKRFKKKHPKHGDILDLRKWHQFEQQHPDSFITMYTLWCEKN